MCSWRFGRHYLEYDAVYFLHSEAGDARDVLYGLLGGVPYEAFGLGDALAVQGHPGGADGRVGRRGDFERAAALCPVAEHAADIAYHRIDRERGFLRAGP